MHKSWKGQMHMRRLHYGWIMVIAGFLVLSCTAGALTNCYSLLVVPISEDLGIARSAMGLSQSLMSLGGIVVPLFSGIIFRRVRLKQLMIAAAIVLLSSYCSFSFAQNVYHIYISMLFLSVSFALVTWMPFSILLNSWFNKKRGLAIGIAFMGSGAGGMVFSAIGGALIAAMGWRSMVQLYTLICSLVVLPALIFVIRERPEDMHLQPYGTQEESDAPRESAPTADGALFAQERRGARLWLLVAGVTLFGFAINGISSSMTAYIQDSGYSGAVAANVSAIYMGALALGKTVLGALYDRLGARRATAVTVCCLMTALGCLVFVRLPVMFAPIIVGAGMGVGFGTVAIPILSRHCFGNREYSAFTGVLTAANNIGGAFSPTIFGAVCDLTGTYLWAYAACVLIAGVFGGLIVRLTPAKSAYSSAQ